MLLHQTGYEVKCGHLSCSHTRINHLVEIDTCMCYIKA